MKDMQCIWRSASRAASLGLYTAQRFRGKVETAYGLVSVGSSLTDVNAAALSPVGAFSDKGAGPRVRLNVDFGCPGLHGGV